MICLTIAIRLPRRAGSAAWVVLLCALFPGSGAAAAADGWLELFNGDNLDGWTPKITGHPLGENYAETFRVIDGLLAVRYDGYEQFAGQFGHLFYRHPYASYHLVVEYRFVGDQAPGGAGWALRNSGVMLHAQDPATMTRSQDFPVSVEAQFLGGLGDGKPRPTGNLCTPGTHVTYQDALFTPHCLPSSSPTFDGDQWVRAELIVRGSGRISHVINGETVLEYSEPQLSDGMAHPGGDRPLLDGGFIALQSESHPVDFRTVRLKVLEDDAR